MAENVMHLTEKEFDGVIASAGDKPVLVDFWASWCGPCRMIGPIIEQVADEYAGKAIIAKVDVDENGPLAQRFSVMTIPTLIFFKNGEIVEQAVGAKPKNELTKMLDKYM